MSKVLIRIKSYEEIEKTFVEHNYCQNGAYFNPEMRKFCGKELEADPIEFNSRYEYSANTWYWHYDWVEVMSEAEQEEAEMNEMLDYFLSLRGVE